MFQVQYKLSKQIAFTVMNLQWKIIPGRGIIKSIWQKPTVYTNFIFSLSFRVFNQHLSNNTNRVCVCVCVCVLMDLFLSHGDVE